MTEKPIEKPEDLQAWLDELQEEREQIRAQVEDARELAEETAAETYQMALADFHEHGSERIQELAEQFNISWIEAVERFGNALAPRPPDLTRRTPLGPDGKMFAPSVPANPDVGDKALFGFTASEVRTLASERGITRDEAASILARRRQPRPGEES